MKLPNVIQMPVKGTLESVVLGFDFSDECSQVLTIVSVIATVESSIAGDPDPSAVLSGAALVDTTNMAQVNQRIVGGLDGTEYNIQCTVTTDRGDTLSMVFIVPVRQLSRPVS